MQPNARPHVQPNPRPRPRARRAAGFTYIGLIVLVAIIGLVGAATLKVDALLRRAAAEEELLEAGAAFGEALRTYAEATPRGQPAQPPSLQDLLKDPRSPALRRHLRKIFVDPMTGKAEWGIVWLNPGNQTGVLAVYSLSNAKPFKVANFDARFANLDNKAHLSDWKFAATGQGVVQGQVQQAGQGQAGQGPVPAQGQTQGPAPAQPSLFPANAASVPPNAAPVQGGALPAAAAAPVVTAPAIDAPAAAVAPVEAPPVESPANNDNPESGAGADSSAAPPGDRR
jgi:type II secretory pathway pseudopilin PulG